MASEVRLKLNHRGMGELLRSPGMRAILNPYAQKVLAAAKADPHDDTHAYENSLHIESVTTDRAVERVVASDPKAGLLEANYGILANALGGASGLVKYTSKAGKTSLITQAQADNYNRNKR